jgi:hypothetical protein
MLYNYRSQFSIERAIDILNSETDYTKAQIEFFYKRYLTKKSDIKFRFYGASIWGSDIPTQELIYSGGDTDPKHQRFTICRRGTRAPLRKWTYNTKMNMPGYSDRENPFRVGKAGASVRLEFKRSPFPAVYLSSGTISKNVEDFGEDYFAEYGLLYGGDIVNFTFPIYTTDPSPGEKHLAFRFYFNFRIPINISY